jgi:hypothetical protein
MFRLRPEHLKAFREAALDDFTRRAVLHVRECLPEESQACTDEQLRNRARKCVERAADYGFATETEVLLYLDVTLLLHENFDTDPRCEWTLPYLDPEEGAPAVRIEQLLDAVCARRPTPPTPPDNASAARLNQGTSGHG